MKVRVLGPSATDTDKIVITTLIIAKGIFVDSFDIGIDQREARVKIYQLQHWYHPTVTIQLPFSYRRTDITVVDYVPDNPSVRHVNVTNTLMYCLLLTETCTDKLDLSGY